MGGVLQQTRKLMGNSQAEMARELGVSREQVSDYEAGKRELRAVPAICEACGREKAS
jgi:transcriptional regulator with XRE-family HTH domain